MRPPPPGLPAPNSPKWHSRRAWDQLGYLRVRTLANPRWQRDMPWLLDRLRRELPAADAPDRSLFDTAIAAATRYPRAQSGVRDSEQSWNEFLDCLDAILIARQKVHLAAVRATGRSGDQVPPADA